MQNARMNAMSHFVEEDKNLTTCVRLLYSDLGVPNQVSIAGGARAAPTAPMGVLKGKRRREESTARRQGDKHAGHEGPFHTQFLDRDRTLCHYRPDTSVVSNVDKEIFEQLRKPLRLLGCRA